MRLQNRFISAGFRLFYLTGAIYGVLLALLMPGMEPASSFSYFSMQSNLICIALMLVFLAMDLMNIAYHHLWVCRLLRFCGLILLLLNLTLYYAVLVPWLQVEFPDYYGAFSLSEFLLHAYTPLLYFLDYLLFDEKGGFRWWHPLAGLLLPAAYAVYVFFYSGMGGLFRLFERTTRAPYFFLDYHANGLPLTLRWIAWIALGILCGGYLLVGIDHGLYFWWRKRHAPTPADSYLPLS